MSDILTDSGECDERSLRTWNSAAVTLDDLTRERRKSTASVAKSKGTKKLNDVLRTCCREPLRVRVLQEEPLVLWEDQVGACPLQE